MNTLRKTAAVQQDKPRIKRLIPLFLLIFIDSLAYFIVIPALLRLYFNSDHSILPANTSMIVRNMLYSATVALSSLAFIISSPIVGKLSDRFGRRITLFYALLAAFFGFLLPIIGILTGHLSLVLIGRFIAGASTSSQPVAQAAVSDFTTGKTKAFYFSLIAVAMTLAMVIGPIAGGYLSDPKLVSCR